MSRLLGSTRASFEMGVTTTLEMARRKELTKYVRVERPNDSDTDLGENVRNEEVPDDQATSYAFPRVQTASSLSGAQLRL
jgi:hypothetical protein